MFDGENVPVWRPITLYRNVTESQDRNVPRTNLPAAQPWNTPSTLDQVTVLAEDLTIVYQDPQGGRWTISDMIIELFKAHLGLPTKPWVRDGGVTSLTAWTARIAAPQAFPVTCR